MTNFIKMVYAKMNEVGIETKDLSTDEAVKKYKELEKGKGTETKTESDSTDNSGTDAEKERLKEKGIQDKNTEKQDEVNGA